jgi:ATP-dependent exoDNAse (exonuclease V) alpha subunit
MAGYYHLQVKIISRGQGRSAVACAAYRSGEILHDDRYGKTYDYGRRNGILETGIALPPVAPNWMTDREQLWNRVEAGEKRKDSRLAREFELAFEHQLDAPQRLELLQEFIRTEITSRGLVADWAIHAPNRAGDQRNFHAHVMVADRPVTPTGFAPLKDRSLNDDENVLKWRESWAEIQNRAFERLQIRDKDGTILRVDHRSYEGQGIDREPTQHLGHLATAMEREGIRTEIGDKNRAIQRVNDFRQTLLLTSRQLITDRPDHASKDTINERRNTRKRDRWDRDR